MDTTIVPGGGGGGTKPLNGHHHFASLPVPSSASQDSPTKGRRKTQPRKRIIIDDDQGSVSFLEDMAASTSKEAEKRDEERGEDGMPSMGDGGGGDPVELLSRLGQFLGEAALQQLLTAAASGDAPPNGGGGAAATNALDAAALSALLAGCGDSAPSTTAAAADRAAAAVHPMLAGVAALLSPAAAGEAAKPPLLLAPKADHRPEAPAATPPPVDLNALLSTAMNPMLTPTQNARTLTLKRKLFDNNKEAMRAAIASISHEERVDLDDLENFAQLFKKQRIKFGFTQGDVGQALGKRYGTDFSQTTISRFEALNLSFKNMCKLRPLLKEWLAEAEEALANGATAADLLERTPHPSCNGGVDGDHQSTPVSGEEGQHELHPHPMSSYSNGLKKRRKRTNLDNNQKLQLDDEFDKNPRPNHTRMSEIANSLDLDRDVVRVWFCNRRQKVRKLEDERLTLEGGAAIYAQLSEQLTTAAAATPAQKEEEADAPLLATAKEEPAPC